MAIILKKSSLCLQNLKKSKIKPKFLIADTIKGKGVKFMEHTEVMKKNKYYNWHAGAPNDKDFSKSSKNSLPKN